MPVGALQSNAYGPEPSQRHGLHSTPMMEGHEGASQTFKKGAILVNSGGNLVEGAVDLTTGIVGVAAEPGHNKAAGVATIKYYPALPNTVFEATLEDETNENHALLAADRWTAKALQKDNQGNWYIDENDATNHAVSIIQLKDKIGTVRGRVYFTFKNDTTIYNT